MPEAAKKQDRLSLTTVRSKPDTIPTIYSKLEGDRSPP